MIAQAAVSLTRTGRFDHPLLSRDGWWRDCTAAPVAVVRVDGAAEVLGRVLACCARRRIDTGGRGGSERTEARDRRALLVTVEAGICRFSFRATGALEALDIDIETGHFTLTDLGPHCQHRLLPVQTPRAADRATRRARYARGAG